MDDEAVQHLPASDSKREKWSEDYYVEAYKLAREGASDGKIAGMLGLSAKTFRRYCKKHPALARALERARGGESRKNTFRQYVYDRLPANLKYYWKKIAELENTRNGFRKIEIMLERAGTRARQHLFLYALTSSNFNASEACRKVNVSRRTFENWKNFDPDFAALVHEIDWHKKNFFEGALCALVERGVPSVVKFVNQTYNRDRGYGPAPEESSHVHTHLHATVNLDDLNLPLDMRRELLQRIRDRSGAPVIDAQGVKSLPAKEVRDAGE